MKRGEILTRAKAHIEVDRAATHGNAEDTFAAIAGAWNWWLEGRLTAPLTPHDIAMMMGLFKDARVRGNPRHADSYEDGCGYRAIAGEIALTAAPQTQDPGPDEDAIRANVRRLTDAANAARADDHVDASTQAGALLVADVMSDAVDTAEAALAHPSSTSEWKLCRDCRFSNGRLYKIGGGTCRHKKYEPLKLVTARQYCEGKDWEART